jgi:subtilisin family serine protease
MPKRKSVKRSTKKSGISKATKVTKKSTKKVAKAKPKASVKKSTATKTKRGVDSRRTDFKATATVSTPERIGKATTIVYIHGIANKPPQETLKCQWDHALFGYDLGERSRFAYWVSRVLYPTPYKADCKSSDQIASMTGADESRIRSLSPSKRKASLKEDLEFLGIRPTKAELDVLNSMRTLMLSGEGNDKDLNFSSKTYLSKIPSGKEIQSGLMEKITGLFLRDVHEYFYNDARRKVMRDSLLSRLQTGGGPFVIVAHSQGSMIAYDVLSQIKEASHPKIEVELFLTVGSPLGNPAVRDRIVKLTNQPSGLTIPAMVKRWVNVVDPIDPVGIIKTLRGYYKSRNGVEIEDFTVFNQDTPWDPHSATGYLRMERVRSTVRQAINGNLFQPLQKFTISKDLAYDLEANSEEFPHQVLIELVDPTRGHSSESPKDADKDSADSTQAKTPVAKLTRKQVHTTVVEWIKRNAGRKGEALDLEDTLENYVSAKLTRPEVERMANELGAFLNNKSIHRIYRDAVKKTFLKESSEVIQATAGRVGYGATGKRICWAVVDSGINSSHPHFKTNKTIEGIYDCTQTGEPIEAQMGNHEEVGLDRNGHGTHVAGIIAGRYKFANGDEICGIAPDCKLRIYKSLRDDGTGNDAKIIKALEHIYKTNEQATDLAIHGVNLSLGGSFDPEAFGCGDSPICKTLRRLWRQGVFVVLAAGNEGYLELPIGQQTMGINRGLSIGDPANLQEGVCVGSIHKRSPHMYGVSYFSSRGPTADGRMKPDLVAPGEQILSCRAPFERMDELKDLYIEKSGTSMAAPHVSGLVAAFLSVRREFIGAPDRTKTLLLAHCTDLGRQQASQGVGMPNLVKLLMNT